MDMQYQLKAGSYYLYDMRDTPSAVTGERRFKLKTDTVAIAFDVHTGEVHQHGIFEAGGDDEAVAAERLGRPPDDLRGMCLFQRERDRDR